MPRAFTDPEKLRIHAALRMAARREAAHGGLRRVPVEALCRAAGISKGAFYLFFPSKEALLTALFVEAEAALRARVRVAATTGPADGRLRAVLDVLFGAVVDHPFLAALTDPEELAWLTRSLPPGALEAARADDDAWSCTILALLREVAAVRPDAPPHVFGSLGAAALALASQRHLIGADRYDETVGLLVEGLVARLG